MKEYQAAVIGTGFIGGVHIEAIRRLGNVNVAALCDTMGAEKKAEQFCVKKAYSDYRSMMDELELDAVHICTPNHTHYEIAKYAIQKGIHVICEKPFSTTVQEAEELVALAKEKGVVGAVNFHNRLYPIPNEMHEMIKHGEAGTLFSVHGGYIQDWLLYETDYNWRLEKGQVGKTRAIADIGSHWMDLVEFVTGEHIKRVCAKFRTVYPYRKKSLNRVETFQTVQGAGMEYEDVPIDTEDEAVLIFELDGGAIGSGIISMVYAGKKNTTMLDIAGSRLALSWNSESLNELWIGHRDQANELLTKDAALLHGGAAKLASYPSGHVEGFADAFKQMFRQFYDSLDGTEKGEFARLEDGLREMRLCEAVYESAMSDSWVEVRGNEA